MKLSEIFNINSRNYLNIRLIIFGFVFIVFFSVYFLYYYFFDKSFISDQTFINQIILGFLSLSLITLSILVAFQIKKLIGDRKRKHAGSQLHWRIAFLFGFVSILPSVILAGLGMFIVDYSLKGWFSERISTAINESVEVAEGYLDEHTRGVRASILAMANDINRDAPKLVQNPKSLDNYLSTQAAIRNLSEAIIIDSSKMVLGRSQFGFSISLIHLSESIFAKAINGELIILRTDSNNKIRGLVKINRLADAYLYAGRFVEPSVLDAIDRTKLAFNEYQSIKISSANFQVSLGLIFFFVALFLLLSALWVGLILANSIVEPIGAVIRVANIAREGNLEERVKHNLGIEEVSRLGLSFNRMLDEISRNRRDLLNANYQLHKRREFTEAILLGVSSGVIGLNKQGQINLPNRRALKLLNLNIDESIGKDLSTLVPEFSNLLERVHKTSEKFYEEQIDITVNKKKRTFLSRVSIELIDGNISGFVVTFDDITELLSAQKKAAWSDIARRIAHEIRNPLTPIQLSIERLQKIYKPKDKASITNFNNYIETIQRQVDDIGKLVEEFGAFARMPSANFVKMDLDTVIMTQYSLFKQNINDIKMSYLSSNSSKIPILIDPQQIRQALTNLFQNSIESINENLKITKGEINIFTKKIKNNLYLIVEDNGAGFPEEKETLTNPYVTLRSHGTGLGLSIVQRIMEEHNGKLILENTKNGGARVKLEFSLN